MSDDTRIPVSAYMITFNNDRTLEEALRSVSWADEIVVVDSFSTDDTLEIAGRHATKVEQREWPGFRDQYQYASDLCSHQWRLFVDADEEISADLAVEMQEELLRNESRPNEQKCWGYHGHRRTYYLGRWIMHGGWVPDHEIRLYDRDHGTWRGDLHAKVHVQGQVGHLKHFYYHYTYENISEQLSTIDKYSTAAGEDMRKAGKAFSLFHLFGNPLFRFFRDYILKRGFLDGMPGFIIAVNSMFYVFTKHSKLWEAQNVKASLPRSEDMFGPRN